AVNARVGRAGEDLIVTGIGKLLAIGNRDDAAFDLIAEELSVRGDLAPEERQQRLASRLWCVAPESLAQRVRVLHAAVFLGHQICLRAVEHLLPAEPVADDEKDVLSFERGG